MRANQLRLWLASFAYVLVCALMSIIWVGAVVRRFRVSGLVMRPFTRRGPVWEVCEPGPNRRGVLEALRLTLVFPAPSH